MFELKEYGNNYYCRNVKNLWLNKRAIKLYGRYSFDAEHKLND